MHGDFSLYEDIKEKTLYAYEAKSEQHSRAASPAAKAMEHSQ